MREIFLLTEAIEQDAVLRPTLDCSRTKNAASSAGSPSSISDCKEAVFMHIYLSDVLFKVVKGRHIPLIGSPTIHGADNW